MKRINLFPVLILMGFLLACFPTKAEVPTLSRCGENRDIPIVKKDECYPPTTPRAPVVSPISCSFDSVSEVLSFSFLFPMGDVTITLTEASTGVVSTDEYSTSSCSVVVPVPCQGTYEVSIVLESGTEYVGQFDYL